jgi:hypothetical protein
VSGGAYGSIIEAFPEQLQTVEYFDMAPGHESGYGARTDRQMIDCVIQCKDGRRIKNSNGNLVTTRGLQIWYEGTLEMGRFIDDGQYVFRIAKDDSWLNEAGFNVYGVDKVVGADGTEITEPAFDDGSAGAGDFS